jgi:hypothetical protein
VFVELLGCPGSGAESKGSDSHVSGLMGIMKSIDKVCETDADRIASDLCDFYDLRNKRPIAVAHAASTD